MRVAVLGATGWAGGELCRILLTHPAVREVVPVARGAADVEELHPALLGAGLQVRSFDALDELVMGVAFTALPAGEAPPHIQSLRARGVKVVDLGPDCRFASADDYRSIYGRSHAAPEILDEAVYGVPELDRVPLRSARLVANPGCYAVAALLAIHPLLATGAFHPDVRIHALNGTTGASSTPTRELHHAVCGQDVLSYSLDGHRHEGEIEAVLSSVPGPRPVVRMTTAHGPFRRGIHLVAELEPHGSPDREDIVRLLVEAWRDEPFVHVVTRARREPRSDKDYNIFPRMSGVLGSNYCHLGVDVDRRSGGVRIVSVIDNLGKGAASGAIQNMNLMLGLAEGAGIDRLGL